MGKCDERALLILAICAFIVHTPAEAWYKQAAGPSYYSVGRASGLLSGIRRSAIRRDEAETRDRGGFTENNAIPLKNMVSYSTTLLHLLLEKIRMGNIHLWPETNPFYTCRKNWNRHTQSRCGINANAVDITVDREVSCNQKSNIYCTCQINEKFSVTI